jgi:hypothetical protein
MESFGFVKLKLHPVSSFPRPAALPALRKRWTLPPHHPAFFAASRWWF